jgi:hypothetical protein
MSRETASVTVDSIKVIPNKYRDITQYWLIADDGRRLLWHSSNGGKHLDGRPFEVGDSLTITFTVRGARPDGATEITRAKAVNPPPFARPRVDPRQLEMWA